MDIHDGTLVVTGSWDETARVWDATIGQLLHVLEHQAGATDYIPFVKFSPDGKWVLSEGMDWTVRLWDVETGERIHVLQHPGQIYSAAFNPSGTQIAGGKYYPTSLGTKLLSLTAFFVSSR